MNICQRRMKLRVFAVRETGSAEPLQDDPAQMVERCGRKPAQGVMIEDR